MSLFKSKTIVCKSNRETKKILDIEYFIFKVPESKIGDLKRRLDSLHYEGRVTSHIYSLEENDNGLVDIVNCATELKKTFFILDITTNKLITSLFKKQEYSAKKPKLYFKKGVY